MADHGFIHQSPASFLSVGIALQLSLDDRNPKTQYGSTLLGWKEGAWLICEWPFHLGRPIPCEIGTPCLVRYMYDGKFIGYHSDIREQHLLPFPLLLLTFPQTVQQVSVRKHARVPIQEPLLMIRIEDRTIKTGATQKHLIGGLLLDMSVSGCCASVQRPAHELCPGSGVRLEFELLGIGHISNLNGIVKNVSEHLTHTEIGIEFLFNGTEFIEYRGWGGSVQKALEFFVMQKQPVDKL